MYQTPRAAPAARAPRLGAPFLPSAAPTRRQRTPSVLTRLKRCLTPRAMPSTSSSSATAASTRPFAAITPADLVDKAAAAPAAGASQRSDTTHGGGSSAASMGAGEPQARGGGQGLAELDPLGGQAHHSSAFIPPASHGGQLGTSEELPAAALSTAAASSVGGSVTFRLPGESGQAAGTRSLSVSQSRIGGSGSASPDVASATTSTQATSPRPLTATAQESLAAQPRARRHGSAASDQISSQIAREPQVCCKSLSIFRQQS